MQALTKSQNLVNSYPYGLLTASRCLEICLVAVLVAAMLALLPAPIASAAAGDVQVYQSRRPVRERAIILTAPAVEVRTTIGPGLADDSVPILTGTPDSGLDMLTATNGSSTITVGTTTNRGRFVPRERR